MSVSLKSLASLNESAVQILWSKGLRTNKDLLAMTATESERIMLATELRTDKSVVSDLACSADLTRIKGIGNLYAQLLKQAKVTCTQDLAAQEINVLYRIMGEKNRAYRTVRRIPSKEVIGEWIKAARKLFYSAYGSYQPYTLDDW